MKAPGTKKEIKGEKAGNKAENRQRSRKDKRKDKDNKTRERKKGSYCLVVFLEKQRRIKIGSLGNILFKRGYYCYAGSAMNNVDKRVKRHMRNSDEKKLHWHIDYLLKYAKPAYAVKIYSDKKLECRIAEKIRKASEHSIKGFGSTDCKCDSHLFYFSKRPKISAKELEKELNL